MNTRTPIALIVLDGWGHRPDTTNNAIANAKTPNFDRLWQTFPHALLEASAEPIGLPKEQIGNSEIGHMTIGAGRVIDSHLVRINRALQQSAFENNPAFTELFDHVKKHDATLHVMGLVSPGGIHSHRDHLYAFLRAAKAAGIHKLAIHAFTDGRDVPPQSAAEYLQELETILAELQLGRIISVSGRFFAMDRDKNWHRIAKAERAIAESAGKRVGKLSPAKALAELYKDGSIDEHLEPMVFLDDGEHGWNLQPNDGIFFFNYRPDRMRQIATVLHDRMKMHNVCMVTMTEYTKTLDTLVAFPEEKVNDSLAAVISQANIPQAHIAETEKYAHVTYFFNGGREEPFQGERHILVESRKDVPTHDQAPEMRAKDIADRAIERLQAGDGFVLVNLANADMVGHTANVAALTIAVETVDRELGRIVDAVERAGGMSVITADHGNAELNVDPHTGAKHTAHTLQPVPCVITNSAIKLRERGTLADIAPTIVELMHLKKPDAMTGRSLVES